jgi:hypothetical protein
MRPEHGYMLCRHTSFCALLGGPYEGQTRVHVVPSHVFFHITSSSMNLQGPKCTCQSNWAIAIHNWNASCTFVHLFAKQTQRLITHAQIKITAQSESMLNRFLLRMHCHASAYISACRVQPAQAVTACFPGRSRPKDHYPSPVSAASSPLLQPLASRTCALAVGSWDL